MEQKNTAATKLKTFLDSKNMKANVATQQAQKMINLYRSLDDLGEDFVHQFNAELLEISENAELMLNALIGGNEVRQYLDYLRHSNTSNSDDEQNDAAVSVQTQGYLPGPEQDGDDAQDSSYVSRTDFERFKAEQADLIRHLSEELITHQAQALAQAIKQVYSGAEVSQPAKSRSGASSYAERYTSSDYSEIVEDKTPGSDAMAGFKRGDNK